MLQVVMKCALLLEKNLNIKLLYKDIFTLFKMGHIQF